MANQLNKALAPLNDRSRQKALTEMFGTDGMRVALALMQAGAKGIADVQAQIDRASADRKIEILMDGEAAATQRMASAWERLKIAIGEAGLIQAFTLIKDASASMLNAIASGPPWFYKLAVGVGALAASIGPLTIAAVGLAKIALPLLALLLELAARRAPVLASAAVRRRLVLVGAAAFAAVVANVTQQALRGQPIVAPDALTLSLAIATAALTAVVAGVVLATARRDARRRTRAAAVPASVAP